MPYRGAYDAGIVAISVLVAMVAAFVAFSISSRMVGATARSRWAWLCAGAVSMGGGIWAMHFIGMLAFSLPCGISYDPTVTLVSMIPGILASGVALQVISVREPTPKRLLLGSVLMGGGIGAMHYAGMAAIRSGAILTYQPSLVAVSVVVAVALALISLGARFELRRYGVSQRYATLVAAAVMGIAVSGMHYTAMQAAVFYPGPNVVTEAMLPTTLMVFFIALTSVLVAGIALIASIASRHSELAAGLRSEIGRRKALESEAEFGRARLQAIVDAVVDAIVTIDGKGRILQWSAGGRRIFGYTSEEVVGADITMLTPEPEHAEYVTSLLLTRQPKRLGIGRELTGLRKDGIEFPIELTINEVRHGDDLFFTAILRDITERKAAETALVRAREEAEAANLAKSQFLATMSHEIRTPMNGVLGMANLLSSTELNDRQRRLVENVSRSGQALLGIINDILDFAKIESGKFELSAVPFDPREAIAELTDLFSERCAAKGIEFVYFVAEDVPTQLVGDPVRLRQVLVNLVGNAIKFTERGEILVEVSLARRDADGIMLSLVVEDTGIGIPAEQCARVFESFHQVDGSMTRARGGSGLGLSISRQLVELMGGRITVESELGRGSRFAFTACFAAASGVQAPHGRHLARPLRALLADGNAVSAHVISLYLTGWEVDVEAVSTIAEAEAAWRDAIGAGRAFDVAILDVRGLVSEAIEFARLMRETQEVHGTGLILLVGIDSYLSDRALDGSDVTAVLPKPVRPSELFNALVSIASDGAGGRSVARRKEIRQLPRFSARILVVEDNGVNQEVASGILEAMGCRVVNAPNGRVGFRLYAQEKFDLILMDCEMPVMDGMEATRKIREIETMEQALPEGGHHGRTPIVALTAHALNDVRDQCLAAGMDDFLVKPFDERQMATTLLRWLEPLPDDPEAPAEEPQAGDGDARSSEEHVIDQSILATLRALDRRNGTTRLERAIARFVEVAPPLAATIATSSEQGDAEALWRAAHSLKSSAGALGAVKLSHRCAEIEAAARAYGVEGTHALVASLAFDLEAAIRSLQRECELHVGA